MPIVEFSQPIRSRRASYVPGDTVRELTAPATDADGRKWSPGTRFEPSSGGVKNTEGRAHTWLRVFVIAAGLLIPSLASAAPKKPSVCQDFRVSESVDTDGKRSRMGACFDAEKPAIWSSWTLVDVVSPDGAKRRYAVGFR